MQLQKMCFYLILKSKLSKTVYKWKTISKINPLIKEDNLCILFKE